jgi:hypothetical protein
MGASPVDHHDGIFLGEQHHVAPILLLVELYTPGEGPEVIKHLIMWQPLSLCLTGYMWFGQASLRSLLKWSIGGLAGCLPLRASIEMSLTLEPPASQSGLLLLMVVVVVPWRCCFHLLLQPLTSDGASLSLLGVASLLPCVGQSMIASYLVAHWVAMLCGSSNVLLKESVCLPCHGLCMLHSGSTPSPPW